MNFKKHCMGYVAAALFAFADVSLAAPGAHGPNGEHLDGPATQVQGSSAPRLLPPIKFVIFTRAGCRPVVSAARVGEQTGAAA